MPHHKDVISKTLEELILLCKCNIIFKTLKQTNKQTKWQLKNNESHHHNQNDFIAAGKVLIMGSQNERHLSLKC